MNLIKKMENYDDFTEAEKMICAYILENTEKIIRMSAEELGIKTYTSAAAVIRFCKKLGYKGYPDFKIAFFGDLKLSNIDETDEDIKISKKDNILSIINKLEVIYKKSIIQVKKELSLNQLLRINKMLSKVEYVDFYVYDTNAYIAQYACSQFFYCGKIANTYIASNIQGLMSIKKQNHLAIIISQTGENLKLIKIAKILKANKVPNIIITAKRESTISKIGDEILYTSYGYLGSSLEIIFRLEYILFSSSVKYILDIMFWMMFVERYENNAELSINYGKVLWKIEDENLN